MQQTSGSVDFDHVVVRALDLVGQLSSRVVAQCQRCGELIDGKLRYTSKKCFWNVCFILLFVVLLLKWKT